MLEYSTVAISTHTHSAYTFHRLPDGKYEPRKVPGLTRRDVRFALKIEELHERFKSQGRVLESVSVAIDKQQHRSMNTLLKRYGKPQTFVKMEDDQSKSTSDTMEIQDKA